MYKASEQRYENMVYNRSGASGVKLPAVSLGFCTISVIRHGMTI